MTQLKTTVDFLRATMVLTLDHAFLNYFFGVFFS